MATEEKQEQPAADEPSDGAGAELQPGEIGRMSPQQYERYQAATAYAREIGYAHSHAARAASNAEKKAIGARALADQAAKEAEKAAERASEADQLVQQRAVEILKEMKLFRPDAKLEIVEGGVVIDAAERAKLQNGRAN